MHRAVDTDKYRVRKYFIVIIIIIIRRQCRACIYYTPQCRYTDRESSKHVYGLNLSNVCAVFVCVCRFFIIPKIAKKIVSDVAAAGVIRVTTPFYNNPESQVSSFSGWVGSQQCSFVRIIYNLLKFGTEGYTERRDSKITFGITSCVSFTYGNFVYVSQGDDNFS